VKLVKSEVLYGLVRCIFEEAGAGTDNAAVVAQHLVEANVAGHDSHGIIRVPEYLRDIAGGRLDPAAVPTVHTTSAVAARVDGNWGFGQVAARAATDVGIELATATGMSAVGIVRCHHLGRMGDYAERVARAGCVMVATAGGHPPVAVGYGGRDRLIGANPIAACFPTGDDSPLLVDMATTSVAVGKILVAAARGEKIPPGVLVDASGAPTSDPAAFAAGGALTPFGGHKGYALALFSELLTTALVGSPSEGNARGGVFAKQAALFIVLRLDLWRQSVDVVGTATARLAAVRTSPPADPRRPVQVPGDPEREARRRNMDGVRIEEATLDTVVQAAASLGLTVPSNLLAETNSNCASPSDGPWPDPLAAPRSGPESSASS
jgi:hydroxycarboxylate dehydrogenase B